ncbi:MULTISPECIES: flagellar hook assembly protein FlgD [unclassified Methylophilus]|jgi:flagellar basal-body rod modification protein FlgD|uniref:flagellar hook assembly protein FlgD n=1 Tax=unclassified Methylophilus TaxID=2630143 RepID=UPI00188F1CC6|nr:flagellar hook assembly protein FlgD [Methylophilus sp. 13]MBF5038134.1 flagellar hook assembly protein FlgD [Methylophilus sp. 13]BEV07899.1 flagellar hook assembly protein FlgD [Methylophilus sp. DW102]
MTTVNTNNQVPQDLLNTVNNRSSSTTSTDDAQDRFMKLLVTQMKNQDPLNPMDNAQVTSQMAQLNTVTGINKLNDSMTSLINNVQMGQSYQATSMIGRNILSAGNTMELGEKGALFGVNIPNGADNLTVTIKNGAGTVIQTLTLGKQATGINALSWDGKDASGQPAPTGTYTFETTATLGDAKTTSTALSLAQVQSVSQMNGSSRLNLSTGKDVALADVLEVF